MAKGEREGSSLLLWPTLCEQMGAVVALVGRLIDIAASLVHIDFRWVSHTERGYGT
jgi:hypothetical protein